MNPYALPLPDAKLAQVQARFMSGLTGLAPELAEIGQISLERISTPNWALEWGLPLWLGDMLGLSEDVTLELEIANVYMLAFGRLADDLVDSTSMPRVKRSELRQDEGSQVTAESEGDKADSVGLKDAMILAVTLHHLWITQYARLSYVNQVGKTAAYSAEAGGIPPASNLWIDFDNCMAQWLRTTRNQPPAAVFHSYTETDFLRLAWRGAPLKMNCTAAGNLAGRETDIIPLTAAVDNILIVKSMLDDFFDWAEDLEAGRYNVFIAYCSDLPQTSASRDANQHAVLKEIYFGETARPYFDILRNRLLIAKKIAQSVGCKGLSDFITWFDGEATACGTWLAGEVGERLREASKHLRRKL